jgi:hypothetical protein
MRIKILSLICVLFYTAAALAQNNPMITGTWKMISGKSIRNDTTRDYNLTGAETIKIITPTHFAHFTKRSSDDSLINSHAGRVKIDSKNYTEMIDFAASKTLQSKTSTFTYTVDGDKLHIIGGITEMKFDEIWHRVK